MCMSLISWQKCFAWMRICQCFSLNWQTHPGKPLGFLQISVTVFSFPCRCDSLGVDDIWVQALRWDPCKWNLLCLGEGRASASATHLYHWCVHDHGQMWVQWICGCFPKPNKWHSCLHYVGISVCCILGDGIEIRLHEKSSDRVHSCTSCLRWE